MIEDTRSTPCQTPPLPETFFLIPGRTARQGTTHGTGMPTSKCFDLGLEKITGDRG